MNNSKLVELYLHEQLKIGQAFPVTKVAGFISFILKTYDSGGTIYLAANGGNAGLCDNFCADLLFHPFVSDDKTKPVPAHVKRTKVVNLTASPSVITAAMNDFGPNHIFSAQLEGRIGPEDLFIGVSGSGNSPNILEALKTAKSCGALTAAITRGSGGKCRELAELTIVIPGTSTFPGQTGGNDNNFHFEDCFCSISHMAVGILQKLVREEYQL
ncbi:MAG: SIS domain-containing protein [bacterium]|nr:SIS domain-containing protein [bacterium]